MAVIVVRLNIYLLQGNEIQKDAFDVDGDGQIDRTFLWHDFNARFYDAQLGRWHVPDPILNDFSPYSVNHNNPLLFTDKSGLTPDWPPWGDKTTRYLRNKVYGKERSSSRRRGGDDWWFPIDTYDFVDLGSMFGGGTTYFGHRNASGISHGSGSGNYWHPPKERPSTKPSTTGETSYNPPPPPTKAEQEAYGKKQLVDLGGKIKDASSGGNSDAWALTFAGLGLMSEYGESGANVFQGSNVAIRQAALSNGMPTDAIDEIMRKTSNFKSISKWAGRTFVAAGVVVSVVDGAQAYNQGDMAGVTMAGMDIFAGLGAAAIGGPVGLILYGGYILVMHAEYYAPPAFVTDPMSPWNTMPRVDNTYVAPNY